MHGRPRVASHAHGEPSRDAGSGSHLQLPKGSTHTLLQVSVGHHLHRAKAQAWQILDALQRA